MHLCLKYLIRKIVPSLTSAEQLFEACFLRALLQALLMRSLPGLGGSTLTSVSRGEMASPRGPVTCGVLWGATLFLLR